MTTVGGRVMSSQASPDMEVSMVDPKHFYGNSPTTFMVFPKQEMAFQFFDSLPDNDRRQQRVKIFSLESVHEGRT
jgi:hypothetical protein